MTFRGMFVISCGAAMGSSLGAALLGKDSAAQAYVAVGVGLIWGLLAIGWALMIIAVRDK